MYHLIKMFNNCLLRFLMAVGMFPVFFLPFEQTSFASQHLQFPKKSLTTTVSRHASEFPEPSRPARLSPFHWKNSRLGRLPMLDNGTTALPSNANNFHGSWNASVNARTGTASFSVGVGSMMINQGQGQKLLVLGYSSGISAGGSDPFSLGAHWSWNVGTEHPSTTEVAGHKTTDITTGDGHGFTMESFRDSKGKTVWHPLRHKLHDVIISGRPGDWTIAMSTGIREHIYHGYEDWEENRSGQRIWFYYDHNGAHDSGRRLICLCTHPLANRHLTYNNNACADQGIWLTYHPENIVIHGKQTFVIHEKRVSGTRQPYAITIPSLSSESVIGRPAFNTILLSYDLQYNFPWLLHSVTYPTDLVTTFLYNQETTRPDAKSHGLPVGFGGTYLPVVTEQVTQTGNPAIPERHIWYRYSHSGSNLHNYTGYQSNGLLLPGRDNLMDRPDDYTYSVTMDNGLTRTTTTYNKYHLPLTVTQKNDSNNTVIAQSSYQYRPWKHTTFASLPPDYSLPWRTVKTLYSLMGQPGKPVQVNRESRYNDNGQLVWRKDASGREVHIQYCPRSGDAHCPPMDALWPEISSPEKVLILPARSRTTDKNRQTHPASAISENKATEVTFDYIRLPVISLHKKPGGNTGKTHGHFSGLHYWKIRKKTTGMIPLERLKKLVPGARLPDIQEVITSTEYRYETSAKSEAFGQISQILITRHPDYPIRNNLLNLPASALPKNVPERMKISMEHTIDRLKRTRITSTHVTAIRSAHDRKYDRKKHFDGHDFLLGTVVHSLDTGMKIASTDTMKLFHTRWYYDQWNRPVKEVITPSSGGSPQITTWQYIYTENENAVLETLPDGNQKKMVMGAEGSIIATMHRFRQPLTVDHANHSDWITDTRYTYAYSGKPASKTRWIAADSEQQRPGKSIALTTTYGYDNIDRPVWRKTPDGMMDITLRDDPSLRVIQYQMATGNSDQGTPEAGPLVKVTDSDLLGKPVASYIFSLNPAAMNSGKPVYSGTLQKMLKSLLISALPVTSLQTYGSKGLLPVSGKNGLLAFLASAFASKAWLARTRILYDREQHRVAQIMPNGATTWWIWENGETVATILPDGHIIHDEHDMQGHIISRCVQPDRLSTCHLLGKRHYGVRGNLLWQSDEEGHLIRYTYDQDGRKTGMITPATASAPRGHIFAWKYNSMGPVEKSVDDQPVARYSYDPATWHLTDREDRITHTHYTYDSGDRLVTIRESSPHTLKTEKGIQYPPSIQRIAYDRYNRPVDYTDRHGNLFHTTHDFLGRAVKTSVILNGQGDRKLLSSLKYDIFGRVISATNGAGITRQLTYDSLGYLSETTDKDDRKTILKMSYVHDPQTGNIITLIRQEGNASATQHYLYSQTDNLVSMTCGETGQEDVPGMLCPRDTDLDGSHQKTPPVITRQKYTFDHWNNIRSVSEGLVSVIGEKLVKTTRYVYAGDIQGGMNQKGFDPHRMTAFSGNWSKNSYSTAPRTISYDSMGRIIRDAEGNSLFYNAFGQLEKFVNTHTHEYALYTYDSVGHQIARRYFDKNGQPTRPVLYLFYTGDTVTSMAQDDISGHRHVSVELAGVAHSEDNVIIRWYLHDYKGDVLSVLNAKGKRIGDNFYSPYGMKFNRLQDSHHTLRTTTALWHSLLPGFNGQISDSLTGYQFAGGGYRAYDPVYRHFLTRDSFSPFLKMDGYGFADNNPIMATDPSGHLPAWLSYAIGGLTISLSVTLGLLMPVASAGITPLTITEFLLVAGVANSVLGTVSGSLQIARTRHPGNKKLAIASDAFGLINGVASMMTGLGIIFSAREIASAPISLADDLNFMIGMAGVTAILNGIMESTISGIGMRATENSSLAKRSGYNTAITVLYALTGLFMTISLVVGVAADIGSGIAKFKLFTSKEGRSWFAAIRKPGIRKDARIPTHEFLTDNHSLLIHERQQYLMQDIQFSDENTRITIGELGQTQVEFNLEDMQGLRSTKYYNALNGKILTTGELKEVFKLASPKVQGIEGNPNIHFSWVADGMSQDMITRQFDGNLNFNAFLFELNNEKFWVVTTR